MKVLLVCKNMKMEYLGVMYLSGVIKENGGECRIATLDAAESIVDSWMPDITGFSIMTGDQDKFKALFRKIKYKTHVIVGGPHPTFFPDDCQWADEIVSGEAENYFATLLGQGTNYYRTLDSIPFPDRTDFRDMPIRDFITSRGCPFKCHYCFNARWLELYPNFPSVRTRSVPNVIEEIDRVRPEFVYFQDSCFGVTPNWMEEFAEAYSRKIGIQYHCHLRPVQINEDMVRLLVASNCKSLRIALETSSPRLKKIIGRQHTTDAQVIEAARALRSSGIRLMIQNMLGLPTSAIEDDLATLEANVIAQPDYAWSSIFVPYPGTVLGDQCKANGWYKGDYSDITDCFFDNSVLEFDEEYKEQVYFLQKVFALCVRAKYIPKPDELTAKMFPMLIHKLMRDIGDHVLYGGVI